ncbi:unnamed protein product [Anisakis simplex]|uniref:Uncharacterized protein n=1 Tax=Anisakis simplex TaxID=6269 RepID=A0A0M3JW22_ANISI|nr:unnamed protein product [Anisakis simplex]
MQCTPLTLAELLAREIDLKCREEVREGSSEPRFAWSGGPSVALSSSPHIAVMFPAWESVRKSYSRNRLRFETAVSDPFNLPPCYRSSGNARSSLFTVNEAVVITSGKQAMNAIFFSGGFL